MRSALGYLAGALFLLTLPVPAQRTFPPPAPANAHVTDAGTDPAYLNGYSAGYPLGERDHQQGLASNPHKFRAYQNATTGWTPEYGPRSDYQTGFRNGFEDGYHDGYLNHPRSIGLAPAAGASTGSQSTQTASASSATSAAAPSNGTSPGTPPATSAPPANPSTAAAGTPPPASVTPPPSAAQAVNVRRATANGYREGYSAGQFDANRNAPSNSAANGEYKEATAGYSAELGSLADYQTNFRSGFRLGYEDGFNHKLYNSAIGLRITDNTASTVSPEPESSASNGPNLEGLTLPQGTQITTILDSDLSTRTSQAGDPFTTTVTVPVWVGSVAAVPAGSKIHGTVETVERAGKLKGVSKLQLRYESVELPGGTTYALQATTAGVGPGSGDAHVGGEEGTIKGNNKTASTVAKGGGFGALIGVITGGAKGAVIGGIAGAAVGTAGAMISKKDIELKQGQTLTIQLDRSMQMRKQQAAAANPARPQQP